MNKKIKLMLMIIVVTIAFAMFSGVYAASASITASKTSVTVGTKVTVTVKATAAAWNLKVSGSASDSIVGMNMDGNNQSTTKTYTINTSKVGTYKVSLTGDISDGKTDVTSNVSKSVTITVKAKAMTTTKPTTTTTNKTTTTKTTTKSSNANISKLKLNVEGLSPAFSKNITGYSLNVGENVQNLTFGVTLENSKAVYSITGNKNLKDGKNVVKITVTAENGTVKTYTINAIKSNNSEEIDTSLVNLIVENVEFTFNKNITEYDLGTINGVEKLNVFAYPNVDGAKTEIIGADNLKEGSNKVIVRVTAKDGKATQDYTLTFIMGPIETDALVTVSPYVETDNTKVNVKKDSAIIEILKANSTIILLYLLALVEFAQVVYLYVQLKNVDPDKIRVKVGRRGRNAKYSKSENDDK